MNPRFTDLPGHMRGLPVDHRGFPVPWFVAWQDGKPFFPAIDARKLHQAHRHGLCWICGGVLGRWKASVIGPMCAVNRISSEPQSHVECAQFAARNCPFLANPQMGRVPLEKYPGQERSGPAGNHLERNPGVTAIWIEPRRTRPQFVGDGYLFSLGEPERVEWFTLGREATRGEVLAALEKGLPALVEACDREPPAQRAEARRELDKALAVALRMAEEIEP